MSFVKRWQLVCGLLLGLAVVLFLPMAAQAAYSEGWFDSLDPTEWLKYDGVIETRGENSFLTYSPPVPSGMDSYEWRAQIVKVEALLTVFGVTDWQDLTGLFEDGNGGPLYDDGISYTETFPILQTDVNEAGVLECLLSHAVIDDNGTLRLQTSITNVVLGEYPGFNTPILGFRAQFLTGIKPVPEPGTSVLLLLGSAFGLVLWRRARR